MCIRLALAFDDCTSPGMSGALDALSGSGGGSGATDAAVGKGRETVCEPADYTIREKSCTALGGSRELPDESARRLE